MVCKNYFALSSGFGYDFLIVVHIINTGKFVLAFTENSSVIRKRKHVAVRIYSSLVNSVRGNKMISYFVARIAQLKYDFFLRPLLFRASI